MKARRYSNNIMQEAETYAAFEVILDFWKLLHERKTIKLHFPSQNKCKVISHVQVFHIFGFCNYIHALYKKNAIHFIIAKAKVIVVHCENFHLPHLFFSH